MRLRFRTSVPGFVEGREIDVPSLDDNPQLLQYLNDGTCEVVGRAGPETAEAADPVEHAVARTTKRGAGRIVSAGLVICLGGGPSLTREDVDRCRVLYEARPGRVAVIAINDAYKLAPWAPVLYACDAQWWQWHADTTPTFTGAKYSLQREATRWDPSVVVLENTGEAGLELTPTGLRTGKNGGYQAINLAVHLGATTVWLLGYDMQAGPKGQQHWFGEHPTKRPLPFATFLAKFPSIVEPLGAAGVTVINVSRRTALDIFPRQALEEAIAAWA